MKHNDEEIKTVTYQLKEWNTQISFLLEKQKKAITTAKIITQELDELRVKHRLASQQLRKWEVDKTGYYYMWENIGDGG
ncbi:conserved hypothetical protein [Crenothrix polyspora]|jgi:hypothetical protein|uniref:Uncharacterized protein n=1 Tax=Crenothrix polyspora TaxID=360316 RepID=A0A1R4HAB1_9GAMM|nr:hypothetical protein [Crenothrix polyspora]SJM93153.1 conserved hypothetical protein [Crenothrix polyspora]